MKTLISIVALAAFSTAVVGCFSSGYDKAGTTSTSLRVAAQSIDNALAPIDTVLITLSDLVNNPSPDITLQFEKFTSAVNKLNSQAGEVSSQAATMQEQGATYLEKWDEELAKIKNDNIQTRSLDRKNAMTARFAELRTSYVKLTTLFAPFLSDLKDIRTALATDLTAGGLASIKGLSSKANEKAVPLRESLLSLSTEFRSLGVALSTTSPAK